MALAAAHGMAQCVELYYAENVDPVYDTDYIQFDGMAHSCMGR